MPNTGELRDFIPNGNCVAGLPAGEMPEAEPIPETFAAIDAGNATAQAIAAAEAACRSCVQLPYCDQQRNKIVDELWARGVRSTVVGGEQVGDTPGHERSKLFVPAFRFNLAHMPQDGSRRLPLLRQGLRAGQLTITSRTPDNVKVIANEYTARIAETDPSTLTALTDTVEEASRERAMQYIVTALCQQADFMNFAKGQRSGKPGASNPRYQPATFDFAGNHETVILYLEELLEIANLGFVTRLSKIAMHHSSDFCKKLLTSEDLPAWVIRQIAAINLKDPVPAVAAYAARLQTARATASDSGKREYVLLRRAFTIGKSASPPDPAKLQAEYESLSPGIIDNKIIYSSNPENALQDIEARVAHALTVFGTDHPIATRSVILTFAKKSTGYVEAIDTYVNSINTLEELYKGNPDFPPGVIRSFARRYRHNALDVAATYGRRLDLWREWAKSAEGSQASVPDTFLREFALARGATSFAEIAAAHKLKILQLRFNGRNSRRPPMNKVPISTWMLHRVLTLYPLAEAEATSEGLFTLLEKGILTDTIAELQIINSTAQPGIPAICAPATKKHITFAGALRNLNPGGRAALAQSFGVSALLYGNRFDEHMLARYLGVDDIHTYVTEALLPRCEQLLARQRDTHPPLSLAELARDIADTQDDTKHTPELPQVLTVVVGGKTMPITLPPDSVEKARLIPNDNQEWLLRRVSTAYPPTEQAQAYRNIKAAVENGTIVMHNVDNRITISLDESFYTAPLSDLDRAAISHILGAGRLFYNSDLESMLSNRLGTNDITGHVVHSLLPKLGNWKNVEVLLEEINCTSYALNMLLASHKVQREQLWRIDDNIVCIDSGVAARIATGQYPLAPANWTAHQKVAGKLDTAQKLKNMSFQEGDRQISRSPNGGIDVYYAPRIIKIIKQ